MRDVGRGGMYVLPKNVTMNGDRRMDILEHRLLPFITIHRASHYFLDGAPLLQVQEVM
jgi:hypothetical protein